MQKRGYRRDVEKERKKRSIKKVHSLSLYSFSNAAVGVSVVSETPSFFINPSKHLDLPNPPTLWYGVIESGYQNVITDYLYKEDTKSLHRYNDAQTLNQALKSHIHYRGEANLKG